MKRLLFFLPLVAFLNACGPDETLTGYGASGKEWQLKAVNGKDFDGRAILTFPQPGTISGSAPCNRFSGTQTAPYPWFETGPIATTLMSCPKLELEQRFFAALKSMTLVEISGDVMLLSNSEGENMLFTAQPDG